MARSALSIRELLLDLALAFPGIDAEEGPENTRHFPGPKASFSKQVLMPDGCPVYLMDDLLGYVDGVHEGFRRWLELRGWNVVPGKEFPGCRVHLLLPHASIRAWMKSRQSPLQRCVQHRAQMPPMAQEEK